MSLLIECRISCFHPVTYLDRMQVTQIRPLLSVKEAEIASKARQQQLPVVHNSCPADKHTRRQEVKELIIQLEQRYPDLKQKLFGAIQRYPLYGWNTQDMEV